MSVSARLSVSARIALSARIAAVALVGLGTGACTDYLARRDGLALGAGDAVHTNIATHLIDPWPASARNTSPSTNGERAAHAVERYRNPQSSQPASAPATVSYAPGSSSGSSGLGSAPAR